MIFAVPKISSAGTPSKGLLSRLQRFTRLSIVNARVAQGRGAFDDWVLFRSKRQKLLECAVRGLQRGSCFSPTVLEIEGRRASRSGSFSLTEAVSQPKSLGMPARRQFSGIFLVSPVNGPAEHPREPTMAQTVRSALSSSRSLLHAPRRSDHLPEQLAAFSSPPNTVSNRHQSPVLSADNCHRARDRLSGAFSKARRA